MSVSTFALIPNLTEPDPESKSGDEARPFYSSQENEANPKSAQRVQVRVSIVSWRAREGLTLEVGSQKVDHPSIDSVNGRSSHFPFGRLATKEGFVPGSELVPVYVDDRAGRCVL